MESKCIVSMFRELDCLLLRIFITFIISMIAVCGDYIPIATSNGFYNQDCSFFTTAGAYGCDRDFPMWFPYSGKIKDSCRASCNNCDGKYLTLYIDYN